MYTEFKLYSRPSFWEGMARMVDVFGLLNEYNSSSSDNEADFRATRSDWERVGADIWAAIAKLDKEQKQN